MSDKQRKAARALAAETGMSYTAAARENARRRAVPCTVPDHPKPDDGSTRTVAECEQYVRQIENAGGTGQWLISIKADHRLLAAPPEPVPALAVQAGLASGTSSVPRPGSED